MNRLPLIFTGSVTIIGTGFFLGVLYGAGAAVLFGMGVFGMLMVCIGLEANEPPKSKGKGLDIFEVSDER